MQLKCKGVYWSMVCTHNSGGKPEKCYQEYLKGVNETCRTNFNYVSDNNKSHKNLYWLFMLVLIPIGGVVGLYYYRYKQRQFRHNLITE